MRLLLTLSLFLTLPSVLLAVSPLSQPMKTTPLSPSIHTIRTSLSLDDDPNGKRHDLPVLRLGSDDRLTVSFDHLDATLDNLYYTVVRCDADWRPSSLSFSEWGEGYYSNPVEYADVSVNTLQSYVHYATSFPNDDLRFRLSGNYAVFFHPFDAPDMPLACVCFCVTEQAASVSGSVTADTHREIKGAWQELSFDVSVPSLSIQNPDNELKVFVQQNDRPDTRVQLRPTFIEGPSRYRYFNTDSLLFEGGREYRYIDISSPYSFSGEVERVIRGGGAASPDSVHTVVVLPSTPSPRAPYLWQYDLNGRFIVNVQEYDNDDLTADYCRVRFMLRTPSPFFDGRVYLLGGWNNNRLDERSRMIYNVKHEAYVADILLKQGGYNFLYALLPQGSSRASFRRTEGSHWQTENQYDVYVYYRAFGERSDRLLTVRTFSSSFDK